jgi:hypothetical protein
MPAKANSGHPGAPMGLAPVSHVLFNKFMKFNPKNPHWLNRDRFVLSYPPPDLSPRKVEVMVCEWWTDGVGMDMRVVCNISCYICMVMDWGWMS